MSFGSASYGGSSFGSGEGNSIPGDDIDGAAICLATTADADIESLCAAATADADIESLYDDVFTGTVYFVDPDDGNDGNNGTSDPWKTEANINGGTFSPGDAILFKRGTTFRHLIDNPPSGEGGNPIVFGSYGTGDNAILSGADLKTSWADIGGDLWTSSHSVDPKQVFFDNVRGSRKSTTGELAADGDWHWVANTLTIYSVGTPTADIEASNRLYCWREGTAEHVRFQDLTFAKSREDGLGLFGEKDYEVVDCVATQAFRHGFKVNNMSDVRLDGCLAHDNQNGFSVDDTVGIIIENCTSHDNRATPGSNGDGINIVRSDRFVIQDCTIYGHNETISSDGIQVVDCVGWEILRCTIYDSGNADIICQDSSQENAGLIKGCTFGSSSDNTRYHVFVDAQADKTRVVDNKFLGNPNQSGVRVDTLSNGALFEHTDNQHDESGVAFSVKSSVDPTLVFSDRNFYSQIVTDPSSNLIFFVDTTYTGSDFATYQSDKSQDLNSVGADDLDSDSLCPAPTADADIESICG